MRVTPPAISDRVFAARALLAQPGHDPGSLGRMLWRLHSGRHEFGVVQLMSALELDGAGLIP